MRRRRPERSWPPGAHRSAWRRRGVIQRRIGCWCIQDNATPPRQDQQLRPRRRDPRNPAQRIIKHLGCSATWSLISRKASFGPSSCRTSLTVGCRSCSTGRGSRIWRGCIITGTFGLNRVSRSDERLPVSPWWRIWSSQRRSRTVSTLFSADLSTDARRLAFDELLKREGGWMPGPPSSSWTRLRWRWSVTSTSATCCDARRRQQHEARIEVP